MNLNLITYADARFRQNAERLVSSALSVGFSAARCITPDDISDTSFARDNAHTLSSERGAGYWLWKPYIILKELQSAPSDSCIIYSDAGRTGYYRFSRYPKLLEHEARNNGKGYVAGVAIPHLGTLQQWTKRDCLVIMDADIPNFLHKPLIQATWSVWTKTDSAFEFLERWLNYCVDRRCLTDEPNSCGLPDYPEFRDHRHDQAIMSILAYKMGSPFFDLTDSLVQKMIKLRPGSGISHNFYKRPQNINDTLFFDNPAILLREFIRLKYFDAVEFRDSPQV